jgi:hypothetical protein
MKDETGGIKRILDDTSYNKKFWEELVACFGYDSDHIQNDGVKRFSLQWERLWRIVTQQRQGTGRV